MADFIFQEKASIDGALNVSSSRLEKKNNASKLVSFKLGYEGEISTEQTAEYYDSNSVLILDGKIKTAKEITKDPNTENRIYEITIYDNGYNLIDGNLNEVFRDLSPEDLIESIVTSNDLTFNNLLPSSSGISITKKVYKDLLPMTGVNDMCNILGAVWRVDGSDFTLYRKGDFTSSETINANEDWVLDSNGWVSDTDKQAKKVIIKGASILQRTTETITGTGTVFTLTRTPENMEISGLIQSTQTINGDYTVDKEDKKVTFNTSQTDPTFDYSYLSQIRVEVGDGQPIKVLEKKYIENLPEARKLGRKYVELFKDGVQSSNWSNANIFNLNINNFNIGDSIQVTNKLNSSRDGKYEITKVVRKYPSMTEITVGEETLSIFDWQGESKDRLEQLEQQDQNDDFIQIDKFLTGNVKVKITAKFTDLFIAINNGAILWASDTQLESDADLISDDGLDEDYAIAYDDGSLPSGSYIDLLN